MSRERGANGSAAGSQSPRMVIAVTWCETALWWGGLNVTLCRMCLCVTLTCSLRAVSPLGGLAPVSTGKLLGSATLGNISGAF